MENNFETKLAILEDILSKKRQALLTILNICENQETLYSTPATNERREFLLEMGKQKQMKIDEVLTCDQMFQQIFDSIGDVFESKGQDFPDSVIALQDGIKELLEIDVKIRAQEEKTKTAATSSWGKLDTVATKEANPATTNEMLNKYRNNNRNRPHSK
ncbi:MAG: hypothetical protein FWE44_05360 [Defluviitaleaceae bacterium]|nr:hypothetical protein [Defluviitaleaceae bacterium]